MGVEGREVAGKRPNIFFKVKNLRNVSENILVVAAWGRVAHEKRLLQPPPAASSASRAEESSREGGVRRGAGSLVGAVSDADPFPRWPHWTDYSNATPSSTGLTSEFKHRQSFHALNLIQSTIKYCKK